jgi:hypothetical protein
MPLEQKGITFVNARAQPLSYVLNPDEIGIFPLMGGG